MPFHAMLQLPVNTPTIKSVIPLNTLVIPVKMPSITFNAKVRIPVIPATATLKPTTNAPNATASGPPIKTLATLLTTVKIIFKKGDIN